MHSCVQIHSAFASSETCYSIGQVTIHSCMSRHSNGHLGDVPISMSSKNNHFNT